MNILIVEDELMVARRLLRLSEKILSNRITSIKHIADVHEAESYLTEHTLDLVLLDLNLSNHDGFELLKLTAASCFQTIIVSANTDKALQAFEYGVLDFVPKPFNENRLRLAFDRLQNNSFGDKSLRFLSIKRSNKIVTLPLQNLLFIKGAGNYSEISTEEESALLHEKSLDKLSLLLPNNFFRLHKSYIVNLNKFASFQSYPGSKYEITLTSGESIPVSRNKVQELKAKLNIQ
jgi:DNA-binding LytR/AlgR family response regulator